MPNTDEVFLKCMKRIRAEQNKLKDAQRRGDEKALQQADENISAYLAGASESVPAAVPNRTKMRDHLSTGQELFATQGNREQKMKYLESISSALRFCTQAKTAGALLAGGGLVALGCLAPHRPWVFTDGSINEVTEIASHDSLTTLAWDANHNGILDHQETVSNATGAIVDDAHAITNGDALNDIGDGLASVGHALWSFLTG